MTAQGGEFRIGNIGNGSRNDSLSGQWGLHNGVLAKRGGAGGVVLEPLKILHLGGSWWFRTTLVFSSNFSSISCCGSQLPLNWVCGFLAQPQCHVRGRCLQPPVGPMAEMRMGMPHCSCALPPYSSSSHPCHCKAYHTQSRFRALRDTFRRKLQISTWAVPQ